ncbi:class I SAM-dependent methyltransferase [Microbacterium sp. SORGH_AS_0862]|uniref:class I SAM-dependent methyltransferase n=1 Tax=Microbacterium sp. SORGH_AS_0862 TaxID=3041789 RepID=UPI0027D7CC4A|nr:class I SAM-dependent methyltransferase [Microbacterium sp. SORGH_AS_0862]
MTDVAEAYDRRAAEYAQALGTMAAVHPFDRQLVETWADGIHGPVLDAGCGPGHWSAHLAERGLDVRGIDLTPEFVETARANHPGIRFDLGTIDAIDAPDACVGGILAWFSTIHHAPARIGVPLAEFARVLRPGGSLVLGFFDADAVEPFDHAVVGAWRWPAAELERCLEGKGFEILETHRRAARGARPVGAIVCRRPDAV